MNLKIVALDPYTFVFVPTDTTEDEVRAMHPRLYYHMLETILDLAEDV
jgi:hypothetical protein